MVARDPIIAQEETKAAYREDITSPLPLKKISNDTHISKTNPDSSMAKKEGTPRGLKYKIHTSIDADSMVILENKVTTGVCHDTQVYLSRLEYIGSKYHI